MGRTTKAVESCKRRKAWAGGAIKSVTTNTCEVAEVLMALRACLRANVVSIGDATATFTGLPIGGVMSKEACSAVLNHGEKAWKRGKMHVQSTDTEWINGTTRWLTRGAWTTWSCYRRDTARDASRKRYGRHIRCRSIQRHGGEKLKWLDMEICTETQHVRVKLRRYETTPACPSDRKELRSYILGPNARMKEAKADDDTEGLCTMLRATDHQPGTMRIEDTALQAHDKTPLHAKARFPQARSEHVCWQPSETEAHDESHHHGNVVCPRDAGHERWLE